MDKISWGKYSKLPPCCLTERPSDRYPSRLYTTKLSVVSQDTPSEKVHLFKGEALDFKTVVVNISSTPQGQFVINVCFGHNPKLRNQIHTLDRKCLSFWCLLDLHLSCRSGPSWVGPPHTLFVSLPFGPCTSHENIHDHGYSRVLKISFRLSWTPAKIFLLVTKDLESEKLGPRECNLTFPF